MATFLRGSMVSTADKSASTASTWGTASSASKTSASNASKIVQLDANGFISGSLVESPTICSQWRITSSITLSNTSADITANWEQADNQVASTDVQGRYGAAVTESSGIFTLPTTGFWLISFAGIIIRTSSDLTAPGINIQGTTNNSTYGTMALAYGGVSSAATYNSIMCQTIFDCTNTTNCKIKFGWNSPGAGTLSGDTGGNHTYATFLKVGET